MVRVWTRPAEFGPSGVRVNAVSPGPTRTEGTEAMGSQLNVLASMAPAGRPAAPSPEWISVADKTPAAEPRWIRGERRGSGQPPATAVSR